MGTTRAHADSFYLTKRPSTDTDHCERKRVPLKKHAGGVFQRRLSVRQSAVTREVRRAACPG
eukprot:2068116-Prymnesium_polylepis.1